MQSNHLDDLDKIIKLIFNFDCNIFPNYMIKAHEIVTTNLIIFLVITYSNVNVGSINIQLYKH